MNCKVCNAKIDLVDFGYTLYSCYEKDHCYSNFVSHSDPSSFKETIKIYSENVPLEYTIDNFLDSCLISLYHPEQKKLIFSKIIKAQNFQVQNKEYFVLMIKKYTSLL